jgi:rod shape determining protein RodA
MLGRALLVGLVPAGLIIKQPDLGSGLSVLLLLGGMILFKGLRKRVFQVLCLVVPVCLPFGWFFLHDYQKQRILTFLDPGNDPLGAGYHILQSQIAIGSGGFWGKGFLEGTQSQLRFLPEKHTDFAFAVFGEEWGFAGAMLLLGLFCAFLYQIFIVSQEAKDEFGSFLCAGVFFYFFWQVLINMGMVLGLMPVVGIPLPFISYGGSASVVNFCLIGLVMNVSMRRFVFKKG